MIIKNKKTRRYMRYIGYGSGAIGMDLSYGLFNTCLDKYFTDILLIKTSYMAVFGSIARIWDGINDPMMGTIVDNTRSKYGKFRPWIVIGCALNALILALLFTNPGLKAGSLGIYIYASVMYVMWDMTNTVTDIPYWSMIPSLTNDPKERNIVATIPRFFSGFGQLIISGLSITMITKLGNSDSLNQSGYTKWAVICALVLALGGVFTFFCTKNIKEVVAASPPEEKFTLKKAVTVVMSNDQLLIFMITSIFTNAGWYIINGLSQYYFHNVVGNLKQVQAFSIICSVGLTIGLALIPVLSKKMERNTIIKMAIALSIVSYFGMYIFGSIFKNFSAFAAFAVIGSTGVGCCFVAQTIMLSDIVDYGEYKLGYRSDSIVFSMKGLLQKIAYVIRVIIINTGLSISGYNGALGINQPNSAKTGITLMMFIAPPILSIIALIVYSKKYKLNSKKMREVTEYINNRREKALEN